MQTVYVLKRRHDEDYQDNFYLINKDNDSNEATQQDTSFELEELAFKKFTSTLDFMNYISENNLKVESVFGTDDSDSLYKLN